jgi:hypothetical protein
LIVALKDVPRSVANFSSRAATSGSIAFELEDGETVRELALRK